VSPQATAGHHLEDDASVLRAAKELHVGAEELAVGLRVSTDGGDLPEDRREVLPSKLDLFTPPGKRTAQGKFSSPPLSSTF